MTCSEVEAPAGRRNPISNVLFTDLVKMGKDYSQGMLPPEIEKVRNMGDKAIIWVFSGGVARAPFHIGVAAALTEAGIPFDFGLGTSAGAVAMEAVKRFYNREAVVAGIKFGENASWDQLRERIPLRSGGIFSFDKLASYIDQADKELDSYSEGQAPTPSFITACDISNGKPELRLFYEPPEGTTRGKLVQASSAIRHIVKPVQIGGHTFVDGTAYLKEGFEPIGAARAVNDEAIIISDKVQLKGRRHISSSTPDVRIVPDWRLVRQPYTELEFDPNDVYNGYLTAYEYIPKIHELMAQRGIPQTFKKGFGEPNVLAHYFLQRHLI